ncbi:MAG: hypothetical protein R2707_20580 [Acidimicrobiales bacterium]
MLTSITPLGERGRGNRFWLTRSWLILGHLVGGLLLGALLAAASAVVGALVGRPGDAVTLVIVAAATVVAGVGDLVGISVPGRRQVDERWLTSYRGWVYGFGFGAQLGFGLVTVVNTLLLGVVLLSGVLLPPVQTLVLGGVYGLTRGVGATLNGRVRTVNDLRRLHRRLDQSERAVRWTSLGAVAIVAVGAAVVA